MILANFIIVYIIAVFGLVCYLLNKHKINDYYSELIENIKNKKNSSKTELLNIFGWGLWNTKTLHSFIERKNDFNYTFEKINLKWDDEDCSCRYLNDNYAALIEYYQMLQDEDWLYNKLNVFYLEFLLEIDRKHFGKEQQELFLKMLDSLFFEYYDLKFKEEQKKKQEEVIANEVNKERMKKAFQMDNYAFEQQHKKKSFVDTLIDNFQSEASGLPDTAEQNSKEVFNRNQKACEDLMIQAYTHNAQIQELLNDSKLDRRKKW